MRQRTTRRLSQELIDGVKASMKKLNIRGLASIGGDVTPATPLARTLAWMEAVAGQFYLAILGAGIVGFKISQAMKNESA